MPQDFRFLAVAILINDVKNKKNMYAKTIFEKYIQIKRYIFIK